MSFLIRKIGMLKMPKIAMLSTVFLVRFGCLFVSGKLTLKLWHDLCFLASRNVRRNALFARIYLVMEQGPLD